MSNQWKALKILIVDDDSFQRTIVTKVLNLLGVTQVASAADGHAAELQLAEGWDLLILDLNMPGMDGIEFLNVLADHALNPALIFSVVRTFDCWRLLKTLREILEYA